MATVSQRVHMAGIMDWLVANEPKVHYAQERPMELIRRREQYLEDWLKRARSGITMDCSEAVTLICKLAGLSDPNGRGYDGTGYTGTLLQNLPHYTDPNKAGIGALVVFGPHTGRHVCMVRRVGPDPLLFSHGQERGPIFLRLSEEKRYQPPPVTFLSIKNL